ncbi:MAG: hypothetical protein ACOCQH_02385, partial [Halanaerobiales bacterium]
MKKYILFIKKHRKLLLLLFIIAIIFAIVGVRKINIEPGFNVFMTEGSHYKDVLDHMEANFPSSDQL